MNPLEPLAAQPLIETIGWTLFHFLWQGALLAILIAITLAGLRRRSAGLRYVVACLGMFAMLAAPIATLAVLLARDVAPAIPASVLSAAALPVGASLSGRVDAMAPALTVLWMIGTFLCHLRYLWCWLGAQRLRRRATSPLPVAIERTLATVRDALAVRRDVRIVQSSLARVPMMIGWLRPVVLLPVTVVERLTPAQLRAVVAHELAHVRRHDYLVNLVQAGFESLLFYHPAVWWLSGRIRTEREYCCDDLAARVCGDTICYARALTELDELRAGASAPALAATGGSLMNRITRLLGVRPETRDRYQTEHAAWLAPALLSAVLITGVSAVGVASPDVIDDHAPARGHHLLPDLEIRSTASHGSDGAHAVHNERPVDVDLVEVVRKIDAVQAEMLALLREAGFENRELVEMLRYLGADRRVVGDVERAMAMEHKLAAMDRRLAAAHEKLEAAVEDGTMTEVEARARLHYYQQEMAEHRAKLAQERERDAAVHRRVIEMEAAGMKREEIDRALRPLRIERRKRQVDQARAEAEAKINTMRKHLDEAMAAGKVAPEKAAEYLREVEARVARELEHMSLRHRKEVRLEAAVDEMRARGMTDEAIDEALRAKGLLPRESKMRPSDAEIAATRDKLKALKAKLAEEVAAGRLTGEEAHLKMELVQDKLRSEHTREVIEKELREQGYRGLVGPAQLPDYAQRVERRIVELQHRIEDAEAADRRIDVDVLRQLEELEAIRARLRRER